MAIDEQRQARSSKSASVPDARIAATFALWFETKTAPGLVRTKQIRDHLDHLGDGQTYERLFLLTLDAEEPDSARALGDRRLVWISFKSLSQAG